LAIPSSWRAAALATLALSGLAILLTRLVFGPVPWADGSAFYLPSLELIHWPSAWKMHAQAAFVPSYDQANFNLMPGLPILLGVVARSGLLNFFEPQVLIRIVSLTGLLAWAWLLWKWLIELLGSSRNSLIAASVIALAALWDPILRWGTLVVRTETWIGLCWLWCLREMHRWEKSGDSPSAWNRIAWRISAGLAAAAYFHFEAAYFVPAAVVGLGFSRGWFGRLLGIAGRTLLLLSPWLLYVVLHPALFWEQMLVQFYRLSHGNHWMSNAYMIFHSLFIEHGSPAGSPKFFNVAKGIFWLGLMGLTVFTGFTLIVRRRALAWRALAASLAVFASCFYLWATKAEVWFITLCHLTFWSWVAIVLALITGRAALTSQRWAQQLVVGLAGSFAVLSLLAAIGQARAISPGYSWPVYQAWVDCIERSASGPKLWQPHVPDVLVELSHRRPEWDLTRALDFPAHLDLALQAGRRMDSILFTRFFNPKDEGKNYAGPLREFDRDIMSRGVDTPFGPWALEELLGKDSAHWQARVCEVGPFWATVLVRKP
jgi:hypothetical protein